MKAAVLREVNKPLAIEEVSHGKPGPREVLVRTVAAGVCHSDLHFQNGSYPYPLPSVLGHESAGVVEAVGSRRHVRQTGRSRDHVSVCVLRPLRAVPDGPHVVVRQRRPRPRGRSTAAAQRRRNARAISS